MSNTPNKESAVGHFGQRAEAWSELYRKASFEDRKYLFATLSSRYFVPGKNVLDYGCGTGNLSCALAEQGLFVTGVDASVEMIRIAKENELFLDRQPEFFHIDPNTWFDGTRSFEGIICSSVLEYIDDDKKMLRNLSAIISKGDVLLISVPNSNSIVGKLQDIVVKFRRRFFPSMEKIDVQFARKRYSVEWLRDVAQQAGFQVEDTLYFELPKVGKWAIGLSRFRFLGVMMLAVCKKTS